MKKPLVSVIIPAYNATQTLSETLESLFKQDFKDYEVIIVDDGSTDQTRKLILDWQKKKPQIKYLYHENKGLAGARNGGIRNCQGKYLFFFDADDLLETNHLSSLIKKSQKLGPNKVAFSDTKFLMGEKILDRTYGQISGYKQGEPTEKLLEINYMPGVHSILFPREAVKKAGLFDQELVGAEDHDFYIRVSLAGFRFYSTNLPTAIYRIAPGSMSFGRKQVSRVVKARIQIATKYLKRKLPKKVKKAFEQKLQLAYFALGRCYLQDKKPKTAQKYFQKAQRIKYPLPFKKKAVILTSKISPSIPLWVWGTKEKMFTPELKREINKNLGEEAYDQ